MEMHFYETPFIHVSVSHSRLCTECSVVCVVIFTHLHGNLHLHLRHSEAARRMRNAWQDDAKNLTNDYTVVCFSTLILSKHSAREDYKATHQMIVAESFVRDVSPCLEQISRQVAPFAL